MLINITYKKENKNVCYCKCFDRNSVVRPGYLGGRQVWIVVKSQRLWSGFIAAIVIAEASYVLIWLLGVLGLSFGGGFMGAIIHLIVAAPVLMFAGNMVKGLRVKGFASALIAAVAIGFFSWLSDGVVGLLF